MLVQITSGYFCAGIVLEGHRAARAAPIVAYMLGWQADRVRAYCAMKRWKAIIVSPQVRPISVA
jgi:hypothetical protein